MLNYKIIDNFIDENECQQLVNDAKELLLNNSESEILSNNRQLIPSTSIIFNELIKKSENWNKLNNKLYSNSFYTECLKNLNISDKEFELTNFFFKKNLNVIEKKYKNLINKKFSYLNTSTLSKLLLFRLYKEILFKVKFLLKKKINLELIFSFSVSRKGYKREIHRDSDSQIIVFLLYLNSLSKTENGGNLNLHEIKNNYIKDLPARPKNADCNLIETIKPKAGRLVLFLNSYDAFHSVNEMFQDENRYFLYGSYTALNKKNPFLKHSADKLKTDFFLLH
tara:strand:- start:154 stop:996 length:843 start_codon:yes stop_codon:yes gene_type:complete